MTQIKINYSYEVMLLLLKRDMHGRELAKKLQTSLTRIQSILTELRNMNILDYKIIGKNHLYSIRKNLIAKSFTLNAENYKLVKIIGKYPYLEPLFEDILKKCNANLIILFGSYAKGIPKEESDIDIYIETKNPSEKEIIEGLNSKISVKIGSLIKESPLVKEIIREHIILKGAERFYELIYK